MQYTDVDNNKLFRFWLMRWDNLMNSHCHAERDEFYISGTMFAIRKRIGKIDFIFYDENVRCNIYPPHSSRIIPVNYRQLFKVQENTWEFLAKDTVIDRIANVYHDIIDYYPEINEEELYEESRKSIVSGYKDRVITQFKKSGSFRDMKHIMSKLSTIQRRYEMQRNSIERLISNRSTNKVTYDRNVLARQIGASDVLKMDTTSCIFCKSEITSGSVCKDCDKLLHPVDTGYSNYYTQLQRTLNYLIKKIKDAEVDRAMLRIESSSMILSEYARIDNLSEFEKDDLYKKRIKISVRNKIKTRRKAHQMCEEARKHKRKLIVRYRKTRLMIRCDHCDASLYTDFLVLADENQPYLNTDYLLPLLPKFCSWFCIRPYVHEIEDVYKIDASALGLHITYKFDTAHDDIRCSQCNFYMDRRWYGVTKNTCSNGCELIIGQKTT